MAIDSEVLWPNVSAANQPCYTSSGREADEESEGEEMTKWEASDITSSRLDEWAARIQTHTATPVLLLSVGHGQHEGELHICSTDDAPDEHLVYFLQFALEQLVARITGQSVVGHNRVILPSDGKDGV